MIHNPSIYEGYDYDPEIIPAGRRRAAENAREWAYINWNERDKAHDNAWREDRP